MDFHKILSSTTVFNIDNKKKCFLSSKSAYQLKDHVTLKTGVMMLKIHLSSPVILNCKTISQCYCFTVFRSNKCSLHGEHK